MTRMISTHLPMCIMNMCYEPVHNLVRVCTFDLCTYAISSLYAHDPHHAHLVEIKHNAYMPTLHSRDAHDYGCIARRDRMTNHRRDRLHMTYHSRDKTPLFSSRFACPYYSRDSYKCQL